MRLVWFAAALLIASVPVFGQSEGVAPTWDARTMLQELVEHTKQFDPLLEQVTTAGWGDSADVYAQQLEATKAQIGYLQRAAQELAAKPDTMTKTLEAYLRMETVDSMVRSVIDGVRRHQNPAVADLLQEALNDLMPYQQSLQGYLVQLVGVKETELKIADEEAQRCRSQLIQSR